MRKGKNLVLTNIFDFKKKFKKNDIILGDWCVNYNDYKNKTIKNYILPYHWNDKKKFNNDFIYLNKLYSKYLRLIEKKLNKIHGLTYNTSSWEVMIGYWLQNFLTVAFDRFELLSYASQKYEKINIYSIRNNENIKNLIFFNDTNDATEKYDNDLWNQLFIENISLFFNNVFRYKKFKIEQNTTKKNWPKKNIKKFSSFDYIINSLSKFFYCFLPYKFKKIIFVNSTIKKIDFLKISFYLKNISFNIHFPKTPIFKYDFHLRDWDLTDDKNEKDNFINYLNQNISKFIPMIFLEGFVMTNEILENFNKKNRIIQNPKIVFTSNSHYRNDMFKIWYIKKKHDYNTKLFIGLHGGGAVSEKNQAMIYEKSIADKYFINGKLDENKINLVNVGRILNFHQKRKKSILNGPAVLLTVVESRYACKLRPAPISAIQQNKYFDDLLKFYESLSTQVKEDLFVRLYPKNDFGWNQECIWKNNFKNIKLDRGNKSFVEIVKKCKLVISTYNATTYNETLSANIPTIIFWDKNIYEIPKKALQIFDELKEVGIFFPYYDDASKFINKNWENINEWWLSEKVQNTRKKYCQLCSNVNQEFAKSFSNEFKI